MNAKHFHDRYDHLIDELEAFVEASVARPDDSTMVGKRALIIENLTKLTATLSGGHSDAELDTVLLAVPRDKLQSLVSLAQHGGDTLDLELTEHPDNYETEKDRAQRRHEIVQMRAATAVISEQLAE